MDEGIGDLAEEGDPPARHRRRVRKRWWVPAATALLLSLALAAAWLARERIAGDLIADELARYDIPATYDIESIGTGRQVLTNVVIGDPARPDATVERVEVVTRLRFGAPEIGRITLVRPRLYGAWRRGGRPSFGTLDPLIYPEEAGDGGLPAIDLRLVDGRALLETFAGPVGIKAEGEGRVDDGFSGILALSAPQLNVPDCSLTAASLYGRFSTAGGKPTLRGPMRVGAADCFGARMSSLAYAMDFATDAEFARFSADGTIESGQAFFGGAAFRSGEGDLAATWDGEVASARYDLALSNAAGCGVRVTNLALEGIARATDGLDRVVLRGSAAGDGVRTDTAFLGALDDVRAATADTLLAPLLDRLRVGLQRELSGAAFAGDYTVRKTGSVVNAVLPRASVTGASGQWLLTASRLQYRNIGPGGALLSGNFTTGGRDLPRIAGRMERRGGGTPTVLIQMQPYSAGDASLAIPRLSLRPSASGYAFEGTVLADGPLPGGEARGLVLPVDGTIGTGGTLALWTRCTDIAFDSLTYANLTLDRQRLTACPPSSGAIVRTGARGLQVAAGFTSLRLAGRLGETQIRIASGPVGFAWPGALTARSLDVVLGPADSAARFAISNLDAQLGGELRGTFDDALVKLDAVPLDLHETRGRWSYTGGVLALDDAAFRLEDRETPARFRPLVAQGATLRLADNRITADARLREPATDRTITDVAIVHDLSTGTGYAALNVDGILFDQSLQPEQLTRLALGVVANTRGVVTGTGRIDWGEGGVTSTGAFSSDDLDFAAAFGPVEGASGTIEFTDLLGLTTAPEQRLSVRSVNPGIEIEDGTVAIQLREGQFLGLQGATWPFMGGTLALKPVELNLGTSEVRRYDLDIGGLDAAQFIERFDLENFSARGTFDGSMAVVFDDGGNGRIEDGLLVSRPPGGNLSYVGELTYEDMGAIANFAFNALRSLDFRQMRIGIEGPLTGEIVTRLRFDGVTQGPGASRNFITRRIGALPLQFNVNIRAPFYRLLTSVRSIYDPAMVRDPRDLGLVGSDGQRLRPSITGEEAEDIVESDDLIPDEPPIQTPESEPEL